MKRRNFLVGTAAVAAASILPTLPALALPIMKPRPDLEKWKKNIWNSIVPGMIVNQKNGYANPEIEANEHYIKMFVTLNTKLIDEHQDLFVDYEPMYAPTDIREHPVHGSYGVVAVSRAFKTTYTYDNVRGQSPFINHEQELYKILISEFAAELRQERKRHPNVHPAFYIPIIPIRYVDPTSFIPTIGFKTRYADVNFENNK